MERALEQSRTFLDHQVDNMTTMLGARVGAIAEELRRVGEQLAENPTASPAAELADRAADYVDHAARYLRAADGERLLADAEALAARNPIVAAGAAFLIGLTVSRFFKTSSTSRRRRSNEALNFGYDDA